MPPATAAVAAPTSTAPAVPRAATHAASAPTTAADGSVSSQTAAIRAATGHRTTGAGRPAAEPRTAPLVTWVVDSANPRWAALRMTAVLVVSAANPCGL